MSLPLKTLALCFAAVASACDRGGGGAGELRGALYAARMADPAARERGERLFHASCALCHGVRGDGDGLRAHDLSSKPRDFTNPAWVASTTPLSTFLAVRDGVPGTSMPAWRSLDEQQIWDVVAYTRSLSRPRAVAMSRDAP